MQCFPQAELSVGGYKFLNSLNKGGFWLYEQGGPPYVFSYNMILL